MADQETSRYELHVRYSRVKDGKAVRYKPGDVVELTEEEARQFAPGRITPTRRNLTSRDA